MVRRSFLITEEHIRPRVGPGLDAIPGYGQHVPFHAILEFFALAWHDFLSRHVQIDDQVILPHVGATFHREVHAGTVDVDVEVLRVGRSSMVLSCTAYQDRQAAVSAEVTLVRFDYTSRSSVPLSDDERHRLLQRSPSLSNQN